MCFVASHSYIIYILHTVFGISPISSEYKMLFDKTKYGDAFNAVKFGMFHPFQSLLRLQSNKIEYIHKFVFI